LSINYQRQLLEPEVLGKRNILARPPPSQQIRARRSDAQWNKSFSSKVCTVTDMPAATLCSTGYHENELFEGDIHAAISDPTRTHVRCTLGIQRLFIC
jgi:hypothetical protein